MGERQAARLGAGDDRAARMSRLSAWLSQHVVSGGEIMHGPWGKHVDVPAGGAGWDADSAVSSLSREHYSGLVRMTALLIRDPARAEEIVQDSFAALHASGRRLGDSERALRYLRQCVVTRSRSVRPRRTGAGHDAAGAAAGGPPPGPEATAGRASSAIVGALHGLSAPQREALVMRYYAGLAEPEIAEIMRISERAVRQHTERALAALREALDSTGDTTAPGLLIAS